MYFRGRYFKIVKAVTVSPTCRAVMRKCEPFHFRWPAPCTPVEPHSVTPSLSSHINEMAELIVVSGGCRGNCIWNRPDFIDMLKWNFHLCLFLVKQQRHCCRFTCRIGDETAVIAQPECSLKVKGVDEVDLWLLAAFCLCPTPCPSKTLEFLGSLLRALGVG